MAYQFSFSKLLNNFAAFQIAWFACAIWHDTRSVVVCVMLLMWLYHSEPWSKVRIYLTIQIAAIGIITDHLLSYFGVLQFENIIGIIPFWLVLLWFLFASTISVSLKWMMEKPLLAAVGGFIFGPAAYWGGMQFDALFIEHWFNLLILGLCWSVLMLTFSFLYKRQPNNRLLMRESSWS